MTVRAQIISIQEEKIECGNFFKLALRLYSNSI